MFPTLFLTTVAMSVPAVNASLPLESELTYFGRASIKIKTAAGAVIYLDPYAPGDYSETADIILVTHGHEDHNKTNLPKRNIGCAVIAPKGAVPDNDAIHLSEYASTTIAGVRITAVPAYNANHPRGSNVGYILEFGGVVLYHAGDTSLIPEMSGLKKMGIDYGLLPCDGKYNMGPEEASRVAAIIEPRIVVPIHSTGDGLATGANARKLAWREVVVLQIGDTLGLKPRS
ncbi:MAG: MBL fold metallo-hydrolase [Spirochaetales bacterium]|nr:MAG: MBL fold metallo-hydrolase [Spirochaetales bacterium]